MTPILKAVAATFDSTNMILPLCLSDLEIKDADYRTRDGEGPSITWLVDHLLHHRKQIVQLLGGTPAEQPSPEPNLTERWQQSTRELAAALESADDAALAKPSKAGPHGEKQALDTIVFLAWHEAYHVGMVVAIRKALGYPGAAEVVRARQAVAS